MSEDLTATAPAPEGPETAPETAPTSNEPPAGSEAGSEAPSAAPLTGEAPPEAPPAPAPTPEAPPAPPAPPDGKRAYRVKHAKLDFRGTRYRKGDVVFLTVAEFKSFPSHFEE